MMFLKSANKKNEQETFISTFGYIIGLGFGYTTLALALTLLAYLTSVSLDPMGFP